MKFKVFVKKSISALVIASMVLSSAACGKNVEKKPHISMGETVEETNKSSEIERPQENPDDIDLDGLKNDEEIEMGTLEAVADTDCDGLIDGDEVYTYHTDPLNPDTDGDGVSDGMEAASGSDPLVYNDTFETTQSAGSITEVTPVSLEVTAVTGAEGAGTVRVEQITATNRPALTEGSLGYISNPFSVTCDEEIESAQLVFSYDTELLKDPDFVPAVYWYNEEESEFVEVPSIDNGDGTIVALVSHFSVYTVLNKAILDEVAYGYSIASGSNMDSNNDGIADIYAQMINDGKILYDNTELLTNVLDMYGDSDDWDGDGLKNGEEISVGFGLNGKLKIRIKSNPLFVDSDFDGIDDYAEVYQTMTSPMIYDRKSVGAYEQLFNDFNYSYELHRKEWQDDFAKFFDFNKYEEAKTCLIDYFYDYAPEETIQKNANEIIEYQDFCSCVNMVSAISNLGKAAKNLVDFGADDSKREVLGPLALNESEVTKLKNLNSDVIEQKKSIISLLNEKKVDLAISSIKKLDYSADMGDLLDSISEKYNDNPAAALNDAAKLMKNFTEVVSLYNKAENYEVLSMAAASDLKYYSKLYNSNSGLSDALKSADFGLFIFETGVDIAEVHQTYGKLSANTDVYCMYLELLTYIRDHSEFDYIRNAAGDLAKIVLDDFGNELSMQILAASGKTIAVDALDELLGTLAKKNAYVLIAKAFIDLYDKTGVTELAKYNVYFEVMADISDGCKSILSGMVKKYTQTFEYKHENTQKVEDYLVQLAQSRIVGDYYFHEYCASGDAAGIINAVLSGESPEKYRKMFKDKVGNTYNHANRLGLKLSKNLPGYKDHDHSAKEDELTIPITAIRAMREGSGTYMFTSGIGAWSTSICLYKDGTFEGIYTDANMGESGVNEYGEKYAATYYTRKFKGNFEVLEILNDYSLRLSLTDYEFEGGDGDVAYYHAFGDTIKVVNAPAPGIEGAENFIMYTPDVPSSQFKTDPYMFAYNGKDYLIGFKYEGRDDEFFFARNSEVKYDSYSTAFSDYIGSGKFKNEYSAEMYGNFEPITYCLRDITGDEIPELFITNGKSAPGYKGVNIYQFSMGKVLFIGNVLGEMYFSSDPLYDGIFTNENGNWTYNYVMPIGIANERITPDASVLISPEMIAVAS